MAGYGSVIKELRSILEATKDRHGGEIPNELKLEMIRIISEYSSAPESQASFTQGVNNRIFRFIPVKEDSKDDMSSNFERFLADISTLQEEGHSLPKSGTKVIYPYDLQEGDVVLITPKDQHGDKAGKIKFEQTFKTQYILTGGEEEHSIYTHVCIVRRCHRIFESLPDEGLIESNIWSYVDGSEFNHKVLRLLDYGQPDRKEIVTQIATCFGGDYDKIDLALLKFLSKRKLRWLTGFLDWSTDNEDFICSGVIAAACEKLRIDLGLDQYMTAILDSPALVTPAHLSLSNAFEDVTEKLRVIEVP